MKFNYASRPNVRIPRVTSKLFVECRWIDTEGKKRKGGMLIEPPMDTRERKEYVFEALRQITGGIVPIPGSVKVFPYLEAR